MKRRRPRPQVRRFSIAVTPPPARVYGRAPCRPASFDWCAGAPREVAAELRRLGREWQLGDGWLVLVVAINGRRVEAAEHAALWRAWRDADRAGVHVLPGDHLARAAFGTRPRRGVVLEVQP